MPVFDKLDYGKSEVWLWRTIQEMEARKRGLRKRIEPEKNSYILRSIKEPALGSFEEGLPVKM